MHAPTSLDNRDRLTPPASWWGDVEYEEEEEARRKAEEDHADFVLEERRGN